MIPRPVQSHPHRPVDFERSSGPWIPTEIRPTCLQLLLLCAALLFCVLLHVVRSLRRSRADSTSCGSTIGDKQLYEPREEGQSSEKLTLQLQPASAPGRGWSWVDALLGRDSEEDEAVAKAAHSMIIQTHSQLVLPMQNDPEVREYKNPIPYYQERPERPPISMAKLIMSRHANPPRRPRSPPKPVTTTATTRQHLRPPSRLASSCV